MHSEPRLMPIGYKGHRVFLEVAFYTTNPHECSASNGRASCLLSGHRAPARSALGGHSSARRVLVGISGVSQLS